MDMIPDTPIARAVSYMIGRVQTLMRRIEAAVAYGEKPALPWRCGGDAQAAKRRVTRALGLVIALSQTLAGNGAYVEALKPSAEAGAVPPRRRVRMAGAPRVATDRQRDLARLRYLRHVFATRPTGEIAHRIASLLGVRPGDESYPQALTGLREPPAFYARQIWAAENVAQGQGTPGLSS